jgi:protein TonB
MDRTHPLSTTTFQVSYGRHDLRRVFRRHTLLGLLISVMIHSAILGSYYAGLYLSADDDIPTVHVRVVKFSDLGPPPSLQRSQIPPAIAVAARARPSVGMPVPVPDAEINPEQTIATQTEMSAEPSPVIEEFGSGDQLEVLDDIIIDKDEPGMNDFVPVEKSPRIIKQVLPAYPEMAVRAGLEGTVWVKILIDREGVPVRAVVIKSTTELFDQPAVDAAMKFRFTPAIMNQGPVKVWVSIPFRFQLRDVRIPS